MGFSWDEAGDLDYDRCYRCMSSDHYIRDCPHLCRHDSINDDCGPRFLFLAAGILIGYVLSRTLG